MKKFIVLLIITLIIAIAFILFIGMACAQKGKISITPEYDGKIAEVRIEEKGFTYTGSLSSKGRIDVLDIAYIKNDIRYEYYIYFNNTRAYSIRYMVWREGELFSKSYDVYSRKKLFAQIKKIVARLYKNYNLKEKAQEVCKKKRQEYLKEEERERKQEREKYRRMPMPELTLDEILK